MDEKEITQGEYMQLLGLLTLARQGRKQADDCELAAKRMLGLDEDEYSFGFGDAIWEEGRTLDWALGTIGVKVAPKKK